MATKSPTYAIVLATPIAANERTSSAMGRRDGLITPAATGSRMAARPSVASG
jgi:hypothetical protein